MARCGVADGISSIVCTNIHSEPGAVFRKGLSHVALGAEGSEVGFERRVSIQAEDAWRRIHCRVRRSVSQQSAQANSATFVTTSDDLDDRRPSGAPPALYYV